MKKLTKEQVIKALKKAADKVNTMEYKPYRLARLKEVRYTNVAGNFKVKACIFTNHSGHFYFSPEQLHATSYGWWYMLTVRNGKLIRNTCHYSSSTGKHQSLLDDALKVLGIKPDIEVCTKENIKDIKSVESAYVQMHAELLVKLENCQKKSVAGYKRQIKHLERLMKQMEKAKIGVRFTEKAALAALTSARASRIRGLERKKEQKAREAAWAAERRLTVNETPVMTYAQFFKGPHLKLVKIEN